MNRRPRRRGKGPGRPGSGRGRRGHLSNRPLFTENNLDKPIAGSDVYSENDKRQEEAIRLINKLNTDDLKSLLLEACMSTPSIILKMKNLTDNITGEPNDPEEQPGQHEDVPSWCKCNRCIDNHNLPAARKCCGYCPKNCLSLSETFQQLCLNQQVVALARNAHRDILAIRNQPIADPNRVFRFYAYRQFVYFRFGYLGPNNRRALPSCIVWKIRNCWPDQHNRYTDFIPASLDSI